MQQHSLSIAALLMAAAAAHAADARREPAAIDAKAAFARLKSLAGEWEAKTEMGGKSHLTYEIIAEGASLVERESAEKLPVMLTVYHLDGDRLILTHYCMAGNQPRMQARAFDPQTGEIQFQFLDATNLAKPGDGHMHNAAIRIAADGQLSTQWEFYENGKRTMNETATYTRVK